MTTAPQTEPAEPLAKRPWQFSLWQLMLVAAGACLVGGLYQWLGPIASAVTALALLAWFVAATIARGRFTLVELLVVGGVLIVVVGLFLPSVRSVPRPSRQIACNNNLRQLLLALHIYHDAYGSFPPAYVADENGRPMHSWRVLILPFIEQQALYDQYRFDEPWDGPNNRLLVQQYDGRLFQCPSDSKAGRGETSYVAVTGSGTAWPGEKAVKLSDIADGTSDTILLVEVQHSGIHWMDPRDLDIAQLPLSLNAPRGPCISSEHKHGAHVGLADGAPRFLPNDTPSHTLWALLTIDGGEEVTVP